MKTDLLLYSSRIFRRYLFYLLSQKWDAERIESYQDESLQRLIRHAAKNVPYYLDIFRQIGLDPTSFRGREDMHRIPLLDKNTLRTRRDEFIAQDADRYGINWDSTSGSTGTPLNFIIDDWTKANKLAAVLRSYQWAGYFPWKKTFSIMSYKFKSPGSLFKHYGFVNLWRFDAKLLKREAALGIVNMMNTIKPRMIIGYPFSILMIAQFARENSIPLSPVRSIVTAGETLSAGRRSFLEEAYQCEVFDFYSHHEDVAMVSECSEHTMHVHEDFAYHEIVDENGNNVSPGGVGELVGTGFYNYAMPLIRYRTGDTVVLGPEKTCGCGRKFRSVKEIIGRQNDYLETPDGRLLGNVLEHSVDKARGVIISQCVQDAVDHMYVNMIVDDTFNEDSQKEFEKGLRVRLGDVIKIDFKVVSELERTKSGKTPFILSKIGHNFV